MEGDEGEELGSGVTLGSVVGVGVAGGVGLEPSPSPEPTVIAFASATWFLPFTVAVLPAVSMAEVDV